MLCSSSSFSSLWAPSSFVINNKPVSNHYCVSLLSLIKQFYSFYDAWQTFLKDESGYIVCVQSTQNDLQLLEINVVISASEQYMNEVGNVDPASGPSLVTREGRLSPQLQTPRSTSDWQSCCCVCGICMLITKPTCTSLMGTVHISMYIFICVHVIVMLPLFCIR